MQNAARIDGDANTARAAAGSADLTERGKPACPGDRDHGLMQCDALIESSGINPDVPSGWGPSSLEAAYNLPSATKGSGQIVAIVDAYDNPDVASDLAEYRSTYGLPKANFFKYNQQGQQSNYPAPNAGWGFEIDLDVDMVSASCPLCTIYLIEANTSERKHLNSAEAEAVKLGAHIVSNSWGGRIKKAGRHTRDFKTPGVVYLSSAGDRGYGMEDPADYPTVVSVGGTFLSQNHSKYHEVVWPNTGGGCSVEVKPSWQHDPGCAQRTGNDVAAVAVGVSVYDTYSSGGWGGADGTSISSPLVAGIYGLAGNADKQDFGKNLWTLSKIELKKDLHAITFGNDKCPRKLAGSYLCTAGTGQYGTYAGPTGWGTPNGIGAF
jgi:subtilase family serine protease